MRTLTSWLGYGLSTVVAIVGFFRIEELFWSTAGWLGIVLGNVFFPITGFAGARPADEDLPYWE